MTTANRLLEEAQAEETTESKKSPHSAREKAVIAVDDVTFRYPQYEDNGREAPTLDAINLHVKKGNSSHCSAIMDPVNRRLPAYSMPRCYRRKARLRYWA